MAEIRCEPTAANCCPALLEAPMSAEQAEIAAARIKALADPARLRLLSYIAVNGERDVCICDMPAAVGLSQPTVSHHMKRLTEAGLVTRVQRGKWAYFSLVPERFREIQAMIDL